MRNWDERQGGADLVQGPPRREPLIYPLVSSICEYVYVLDFDKPLFEGTMGEVLASEVVVEAYLGSGTDLPTSEDEEVLAGV